LLVLDCFFVSEVLGAVGCFISGRAGIGRIPGKPAGEEALVSGV